MCTTKLIRITLFSIFFVVFTSCKNENTDIIPNTPIYIEPIYVNDPEYQELFTLTYGSFVVENIGYKGNGVIIVNLGNNEFAAYDCTCTNEVKKDCFVRQKSVCDVLVYCKCCNSCYEIVNGSATTGDAIHPLKKYKVSFDGEYLLVYNN